MTKIGKCETCRQRKVRCDEVYPVCGSCLKRNRLCQYTPSKIRRIHVTLLEPPKSEITHKDEKTVPELQDADTTSTSGGSSDVANEDSLVLYAQSTKIAKDGCGVFKIFGSCRMSGFHSMHRKLAQQAHKDTCRVAWSPTSPDESLRSRFIALLEARPIQWNPSFLWGKWLMLVASRLGRSKALDDATLCFIAGCFAHQNRSDENVKTARKTYGRALSSVQHALVDQEKSVAFSSETIAATKFLAAFETMLDLKSGRWICHCRGLGSLLASRGYEADEDDMFRSLYYSLLPHEFNEAVSNGTASAFDLPGWLHFPPPSYARECLMFQVVYKAMMQLIVRMPRLVRLVREVRSDPFNAVVAADASALAEKMYQTDLRRNIHGLVAKFAKRVPTFDKGLARYYFKSIHFPTVCVFEALMRYCFCRIIIIGLCRKLIDHGLFAPVHSTSTLAEEEIETAEMVAMSVEYAEQLKGPIPMGAFLAIVPLQVAAGSWCRLERDLQAKRSVAEVAKGEELDKAQFMMNWCRTKSNDMLMIWNGEQMSNDMLKSQMEVLEGGALEGWTGQTIFPL